MALLDLDRAHGPFAFVLREVAAGTTTWEYTVDPAHFNPNGVLHGGVLMALLDTAMGHAVSEIVMPQGRINAAAACLDRWADSDPQRLALGWDTEAGDRRDLDYAELTRLADGRPVDLEYIRMRGDRITMRGSLTRSAT